MIPVSKPNLTIEDIEAVKTCVQSGWITQGKRVKQFEDAWAAYTGVKHCIMTSSGTAALQLALSALGIVAGDEVIIPDLTFAAVANAVIAGGATPVCVDVRPDTWNIDPTAIFNAATGRTKAIIAVHSYGNPIDIEHLKRVTQELDIPIIEDCAEAHGATINGKKVGSFGTLSVFSFYANKVITTGEGGCVCTDNDAFAARLRLLCNHGMDPDVKYLHHVPGFNYRMTDMQAALGLSQLERMGAVLGERELIWVRYNRGLKPLGFIKAFSVEGAKRVNWLYTALCPEHVNLERLAAYLKEHGVETRPMFWPISSFTYANQPRCGNAAYLSARGISLPTYNGLTTADQNRIIELIGDYVRDTPIH